MTKCQCYKKDGKPCTRDSSQKLGDDPQYCWQHQGCQQPIQVPPPRSSRTSQPQSQPRPRARARSRPNSRTLQASPKPQSCKLQSTDQTLIKPIKTPTKIKIPTKVSLRNQNSIMPPPEFSKPKPADSECENEWDPKYSPKISNQIWKGKDQFVTLVEQIQKQSITITGEKLKFQAPLTIRKIPYTSPVLCSFDGTPIGNNEYSEVDKKWGGICWVEGYAEHSIAKHNVMPTQKFYNYIINKSIELGLL